MGTNYIIKYTVDLLHLALLRLSHKHVTMGLCIVGGGNQMCINDVIAIILMSKALHKSTCCVS